MSRRASLALVSLLLTGFSWGAVDPLAVLVANQSLDNSQLHETVQARDIEILAAKNEIEELVSIVVAQEERLFVAEDRVAFLEGRVTALRQQNDELVAEILITKTDNWELAHRLETVVFERANARKDWEQAIATLGDVKEEATATKLAAQAEKERLEDDVRILEEEKIDTGFKLGKAKKERDRNSWDLFRANTKYKICKKAKGCRDAVAHALNAQVRDAALSCMGRGEASPVLVRPTETAELPSRFIVLEGISRSHGKNWTVAVCDITLPDSPTDPG
jgi:hypothetical protein